jgi:ETFB lysine methyltransferase
MSPKSGRSKNNNTSQQKFIREQFCFGTHQLQLLKIADLDTLVDTISDDQFNVDERLPYWAEIWPSAIALSRFIFKNPNLFQKRRILELGCGLGLTSMAIMLQQPEYFLCSDYEAEALQLARENFILNKIDFPHFQLLDWREPQIQDSFDLIIASDILYEKRFFQPIFKLFKNYIAPHGMIIIAEPNRSIARDFFTSLKERGYSFSFVCEPVEQGMKTIAVSIYTIHR